MVKLEPLLEPDEAVKIGAALVARFDHIYCLNLDSRTDRWEETLEHLGHFGLVEDCERFPGVNFHEDPSVTNLEQKLSPPGKSTIYSLLSKCGCITAHRNVAADALNRGFSEILVFEDDVKLLSVPAADWEASLEQLESVEWDLFFLGATYNRPLGRVASNLLHAPQSAHGYHACAYGEQYCQRILDEIPDNVEDLAREAMEKFTIPGFDVWLQSDYLSSDRVYCSDPLLATQRQSESDITNLHNWDIESFQKQLFEKQRPN